MNYQTIIDKLGDLIEHVREKRGHGERPEDVRAMNQLHSALEDLHDSTSRLQEAALQQDR